MLGKNASTGCSYHSAHPFLRKKMESKEMSTFGGLQPLLTSDCNLGRPEPEPPSHTAPDFLTQRNHEAYSMKLAVFSISGLDNWLCSNRQITHPLIVHTPPLYFEKPTTSTVGAMGTPQWLLLQQFVCLRATFFQRGVFLCEPTFSCPM